MISNKIKNWDEFLNEKKQKCLNLFHSTTQPISGGFNVRGNAGYGIYLAKSKRISKVFGNIVYKVKVCPLNTLVFHDNEVKKKGFFNMSKKHYDDYISQGYDSLIWYRNGKFMEMVVLDPDIIEDYSIIGY